MTSAIENTENKIQELQMVEQNLQSYLQQKQTLKTQELEIDSALNELKNTSCAYKIVGNIMVKSSNQDLSKDLESKKELISVRLKAIDKQEEKLRDKAKNLQQEILKNMDKSRD
jgi:prefoldin beta subunit